MTMLMETLGFFTLLGVLFAGFMFALRSTQQQSQKQETAASETIKAKEELEQKAKSLQDQVLELRQELALRNQMLEGLRGQYEEMEKDYEKLRAKTETEAQTTPPPATHLDSGSPLINII